MHVCVCVCVNMCVRVLMGVCAGGWGVYGRVVEVVRTGSGKLIDGNRMFYRVAGERETESVYGGQCTFLSLSCTQTHT